MQRLLAGSPASAIALVRNPDHVAELEELGSQVAVVDLEHSTEEQVAHAIEGADAAVFAAGAGPGSGAARKETMDRAGAELFAKAAQRAGVRRHVLISAMSVDEEPGPEVEEVFAIYLRAKGAAERALRELDLDLTILRPGGLTNDEPTGLVDLAPSVERGQVTRADVAAVTLALLDEQGTIGSTLELVGGDTPISQAVKSLAN